MAYSDGSSGASDEDLDLDPSLFQEPSGYLKPEEPAKFIEHTLHSGQTLRLRLVGHNPLWGHYLWNGAQVLSAYLQEHPALVRGKSILELGAGAGLPSLVASGLGAEHVVVTDYPDADLIENLGWNIEHNTWDSFDIGVSKAPSAAGKSVVARGYLWGADPATVLDLMHVRGKGEGFDVLLMADLLFNHSCHEALVSSICMTMKKTMEAKALVFFTPYRPWLFEKDLAFFDLCREKGLVVDKLLEEEMGKVMFENDRGDETLRRTVFGYEVKWGSCQGLNTRIREEQAVTNAK